jgi:hypothetical protein
VLAGKADKGAAAVAGQLLNTYLRVLSVELKVKEMLELEQRLEDLESMLEQRRERGYGA